MLEPPDCRASGIVLPYAPIREADVMWERRVWRTIDLRAPLNTPFRSPQEALPGCMGLFAVVRHGLLDEGGLTAYDPGPLAQDDAFQHAMTREQLRALFAWLDTVPETVDRFMIKEDWIFDRARSKMDVRIIGLAPLVEVRGTDGELRGHRPLLWLYYPECRHLFAWWAASITPDGQRFSYEGLLAARRFESTIVKVSNMQDRAIAGHRTGLDALLESDGLRRELLNMGFDLWNY